MVTSVPLTAPEEVVAAWSGAAAEGHTEAQAAATAPVRNPALGALRTRRVCASPKGEKKEGNTSHPAPSPPAPDSGEAAPAAFLRTRLERKLPAPTVPTPPPRTPHECRCCAVPVPAPGICLACAGLAPAPAPDRAAVDRNRRGAARARDLLRSARPVPLPVR